MGAATAQAAPRVSQAGVEPRENQDGKEDEPHEDHGSEIGLLEDEKRGEAEEQKRDGQIPQAIP